MWKPNNQNGFAAQPRTAYVPTSTAPQQQFQPQNVPPAQQPVPQNAPMPVQNQAYPQNQYSGASRQQPQQYQQNNSIPSAPPAGYQPPSAPVNQAPQNGNARPPQQNSAPKAPSVPGNDFINAKITWMDGKDKKLDFSDCLIKANPEDYANIHGCGGKGHAPNSSICLTLCDYSKGTGDKSVTVKVNLDVRYIDTLLSIAQTANSGVLGIANQLRGVKDFSTANGVVIGWLQSGHQPTMQELAGLQQTLCNGLVAQDPGGQNAGWSDGFQKNNPYKTEHRNGKEYAPVSIFSIAYDQTRNYPWTIRVTNCMAPLVRKENGATSHNAKEAVDKKEVVFFATTKDWLEALASVDHYIRLWEYRMYPIVQSMCQERERRRETKKNESRG